MTHGNAIDGAEFPSASLFWELSWVGSISNEPFCPASLSTFLRLQKALTAQLPLELPPATLHAYAGAIDTI